MVKFQPRRVLVEVGFVFHNLLILPRFLYFAVPICGIIMAMTTQDTTETSPLEPTQPDITPNSKKTGRGLWFLIGILLILILGGGGGLLGYRNGIDARVAAQKNQVILEATTQYQYALVDFQEGRLATARQRLEYVIELDPTFPDAQQKLTEVMLQMAILLTPTPEPTPTVMVSPTPDFRPVEELYNQAQQQLRNKEWANAIATANAIRSASMEYRTVQVDGIYYVALRNLGVQKILNDGDLEGGMYMLTLTERFGPLDRDAEGYRTWARFYIVGASFWNADWKKVIDYFGEFYLYFPGLRDTSGMTATERFRIANIRYGDQLAGLGQFCDARPYYEMGLSLSPDPIVQSTLDAVYHSCDFPDGEEVIPPPVESTPTPTLEVTPTIDPAIITPEVTVEPTVEVTPAP